MQILKYVFVLILVSFAALAGEKLTDSKSSLRIFAFKGKVYYTGIKNKGIFNLEGKVLLKDAVIVNFYENKGRFVFETDKGFYVFDGKKLGQDKNFSPLVLQKERKIYLKKDNRYLKISPDKNDVFYAPKIKNNFVLYSSLKSGLFLYDIKNKKTKYISKGVDASFSSDGKKIVFAKVYDDGENYIGSEIFIYDMISGKLKKTIPFKKGEINRYPYLFEGVLYFNKNLDVFKMDLKEE